MRKMLPTLFTLLIAFVFVQSLYFKFTGSTETQYIFNTLDEWAGTSLGIKGLFTPPGPFNAYVVAVGELVSSLLLLIGLFGKRPRLTRLGALLALLIISGAIFAHLFTPLGIDVLGDGGMLFGMAVAVFVSAIALLALTKRD